MRHILKPRLWRMDSGRWTADDGRLTVDYAPFHCHAINHFVTSRVLYTPHETFLAAVYFLFLPLCHAFNLVFSSRNLDARQRKSILGRAINYFIFFSFPWLSRHEMSISTDHRVFFYLSTGHVSNKTGRAFPAVSLILWHLTKGELFFLSDLYCHCVTKSIISWLSRHEM